MPSRLRPAHMRSMFCLIIVDSFLEHTMNPVFAKGIRCHVVFAVCWTVVVTKIASIFKGALSSCGQEIQTQNCNIYNLNEVMILTFFHKRIKKFFSEVNEVPEHHLKLLINISSPKPFNI